MLDDDCHSTSLNSYVGLFRSLLTQKAFLEIYGSRCTLGTQSFVASASSTSVDPVVLRLCNLASGNASLSAISDSVSGPTSELPLRTRTKAYNALGNLFAYRSGAASPLCHLLTSVPWLIPKALECLKMSAKAETEAAQVTQLRLAAAKLLYNISLILPKVRYNLLLLQLLFSILKR